MELLRSLDSLSQRFRRGAVSIGNFDGVHRGHARLAERLVAMARRVEGPAVVFTFDPHPAQVLRPEAAPTPLGWTERNARLLGEMSVDAVIAYPTNKAFLQLGAKRFFNEIVRESLDARAIVEGPNFFFGHDRTGTVDVLCGFCAEVGIEFEVVEPVTVDGQPVSSSRIRTLVRAGRLAEAHRLLGRPYRIRGRVIRGARRGAALGFPTANLDGVDTLLPGQGIYAGRVPLEGTVYPAAVSIGPNPTFDETHLKVEAYLLGYDGSLHGRVIELDFLARLREISRFDSAEQLVVQMARDVEATRQIVEHGAAMPNSQPSI